MPELATAAGRLGRPYVRQNGLFAVAPGRGFFGGRASCPSPDGVVRWLQDADDSWWYIMADKRVQGGWRDCAECGAPFLCVFSKPNRFCGKTCAVKPSNQRRASAPGTTRKTTTGYIQERVATVAVCGDCGSSHIVFNEIKEEF